MAKAYAIDYIPEFGKFGAILNDKPHLGWIVKGQSYLEVETKIIVWMARQALKQSRMLAQQSNTCVCPACAVSSWEQPAGYFINVEVA